MNEKLLKLNTALAVPTRHAIYQYVLKHPEGVTVNEVADTFEIHPNVARLHLSKLEEVHLIVARTLHTGRGGRPGRVYTPAEKAVNLSFPPRDYEKLSEIAIKSLESLGIKGEESFAKQGEEAGYQEAMRYIEQHGLDVTRLTLEDVIEHAQKITGDSGLLPSFEPIDAYSFRFHVHGCTYRELIDGHPTVCTMHHAQLKGIFRAFLGKVDLLETNSMLEGASSCSYIVVQLP